MEAIMEIMCELIGALVGVAVVCAAKVACDYLGKLREDKNLDKLISSGVKAAEQLFKEDDDTGEIRLAYVQNLLIEAGYDLTEAVMALVESKVYELNIEARK